jgi:predicted tellurium resistance membrane protein TerC
MRLLLVMLAVLVGVPGLLTLAALVVELAALRGGG